MGSDINTTNPVEGIKQDSNYLRGSIAEGLENPLTGSLDAADTQLTKFHGIYQQDDRDLRTERQRQKLEPAFSFMIRARVPGGICTAEQWLLFDHLAGKVGQHGLRLTTRQAFQLHGVIKQSLKPTIQQINRSLMDTIAACGDVNRNVMCSVVHEQSDVHRQAHEAACRISERLTPKTSAYHEIWLDGEKLPNDTESGTETASDHEPIYGKHYLPRKFKIAVAVPPRNDVDIYANDLGFIAIESDGKLAGFNVTVGGGMGVTHQDDATFPRRADDLAFVTADQVVDVAEAIVTIQRDFGDRSNRKHARFKYTIADRGLDWFRSELESRLGQTLESPRPVSFTHSGDRFGWIRTDDDRWHLNLFVENGRVLDHPERRLRTALAEVATILAPEFRLTPNQNIVLANIADQDRDRIDAILSKHGVEASPGFSLARLNAMACVALPTCSLAMAESERYLPSLIDRIEALAEQHGISDQPINIRMTGCPNGCARPYLAEIGLVGKSTGRYNLHLGASHDGRRLNRLYREYLDEAGILEALDGLFATYAAGRRNGQSFGDFIHADGLLADAFDDNRFNDQSIPLTQTGERT